MPKNRGFGHDAGENKGNPDVMSGKIKKKTDTVPRSRQMTRGSGDDAGEPSND